MRELVFVISYLGKLSDRNADKILKWGIYTHAVSWILKMALLFPVGILFSNFFSSATNSAIEISFHKKMYQKAGGIKNIINYFIFREFNLEIGRIFILLIFIFVLIFITDNLMWMFIVAFFITFGYSVLLKEK